MKSPKGPEPRDGLGQERLVSPLEERILRMHLGVPAPHREALENSSQGHEDIEDSLKCIEADVLARAPVRQEARPRGLRLVTLSEG